METRIPERSETPVAELSEVHYWWMGPPEKRILGHQIQAGSPRWEQLASVESRNGVYAVRIHRDKPKPIINGFRADIIQYAKTVMYSSLDEAYTAVETHFLDT